MRQLGAISPRELAPSSRMGLGRYDLQTLVAEKCDEVDDSAGVTPLVVVPGHYFQQVAADHLGELAVDNRAVWVAEHVGGNHGIVRIGEDALQRPGRGSL